MLIAALLLAATASPFDQVVAAERAFAAASVKNGLHESFLANLAPDAISFLPLPGPARPKHEGQPHSKSTLNWGPEWVAVSSAGDLALSTGPWEIRPDEASAFLRVPTGLFISVWQRQASGAWKVAVDAGISSPLKFQVPTSVENGSARTAATAPRPSDAANARLAITSAERTLSAAAKSGLGEAIAKQTEPAARIYREGQPAGAGTLAARALLATDKRRMACTPDRVTASTSGDFGFTYGTCTGEENGKPASYGFLHVWRKQADGSWRILVDVTP